LLNDGLEVGAQLGEAVGSIEPAIQRLGVV
jgi:hypothetical protein